MNLHTAVILLLSYSRSVYAGSISLRGKYKARDCLDVCLEEISASECPSISVTRRMKTCDQAEVGELCEGDGECGTHPGLDNCNGSHEVYRRVQCQESTMAPIGKPSKVPTNAPTDKPTSDPTNAPPTRKPTTAPTQIPTGDPTTQKPTTAPTKKERCEGQSKHVKIYRFQIKGEDDSGPHGEHKLKLNDRTYFPRPGHKSDCPGGSGNYNKGHCEFKEDRSTDITKSQWWTFGEGTIKVGTEESDTGIWNSNDHHSALVYNGNWHIDTCEQYDVIVSRDFKERNAPKVAWNLSASLMEDYKSIHGSLPTDVESWSNFRIPSDSYVWYLAVKPTGTNDLVVPLDGMKKVMN